MTLNQEVEIIYLYIVEGLSMEKAGEATGWETSVVSQTVRDYGFNDDAHQRSGWQSGKDRGRYGRGKSAARGVNVTRQLIKDFLQCADEWEWDFEWYISEIAKDIAEQNRSWQQQQQQRAAQQQRERQQRLQAEQNARQERERREREAREQQIRQQEYERQKKEQQKKNTNEYYRLVDIGKKALKENRLQQALDSFYDARKLFDAVELYALIAEVLAKSGNADTHCQSIVRELREYENCIKRDNKALTEEQLLWYARALACAGQLSSAATRYSMAAHIEYDNKNYVMADAIFKESYNKTGIFTNWGTDKFFKLAYSRSCIDNMTPDDHRFCIDAYIESSREKEGPFSISIGNKAWHYLQLGENQKAASEGESAIVFGNNEPYVYHNLVEAYMNLMQFDKAYKTFEKMEKLKISYQPWKKAECIYRGNLLGDESWSKAEALYKNQLAFHGFHSHSCYRLICGCKSDYDACEYGQRFMTNGQEGTQMYKQAASAFLERARKSGIQHYINIALDYNPDEKAWVEKQKAQEKQRIEQLERQRLEKERLEREEQRRIEQEKRQQEEEQRRLEEEKRRKEEEQRRLEEEKRRKEEEQRQMKLAKQKAEEEMLMLLF